jgi:HSP20 family molecular chaperone IbpA
MSAAKEHPRAKRAAFTVERVLLTVILGMQLVIAWGLFWPHLPAGSAEEEVVTASEVAGASDAELHSPLPRPSFFPAVRRDPFEEMDAMFSDALENMARLRSAMHIDEGWERIAASPTMDMRAGDADYVVSFSIPGAQPSDIEVTLDGRVLTVEALAPVRGASYARMQRFERRVLLPGPVGQAENAHASITNGILRVHVPKGPMASAFDGARRLF